VPLGQVRPISLPIDYYSNHSHLVSVLSVNLARAAGDDINFMLKEYADEYVVLPQSLLSAVDATRSLHLDVLVFGDVFMDSTSSHLVMHRMAPVQILFWGHPVSLNFSVYTKL